MYFYHLFSFLLWIQSILSLPQQQHVFNSSHQQNDTLFIDLSKYLNNKGASGHGSNFDGTGAYFKHPIPSNIGTLSFQPPENQSFDNIVSLGQTIPLPSLSFGSIYLLCSVNHGPLVADLVIVYQDGSHTTTTLNLPDWQVQHTDQITRLDLISHLLNTNYQATLFSVPLLLDPSKPVSHLSLPYTNPIGSFRSSLHIFGINALLTTTDIKIISVKGTTRWYKDKPSYQIITVDLHNTSPNWLHDISILIYGSLLKTKYEGHLKRLAPGHKSTIEVVIYTVRKTREPTEILVEVLNTDRNLIIEPVEIKQVEIGLEPEFNPTSIQTHTAPSWFQSAKFGIFIHWGLYSLPSWAPVGHEYAEWYWWNYNRKYSSTYYYHRSFYGPDIEYDHFIPIWNPTQFNPTAWLDLIHASRAKYFVFTSKHHDGISLFNTSVNDRSTVKMNPYRDFLKELLDTAQSSFPHLKRGIYFSLPEWFHPSYHDASINWNGPPTNPYTGKVVPYTNAPPVTDFVKQIQVPQILELIHDYHPDIMWCDIGGINNSSAWQSLFINKAKSIGNQVVMNDRCGNSVSDFSTVEYRAIDYVPERSWEAVRGIDPHSFGFNHQTKPEQYASTISLLHELISTIAKGGNFLLSIGPEGSGRVPDIMIKTLREIGIWIDQVKEAIFDTIPYWVTSSDLNEIGQPLYFMQSKDGKSIYIFSLQRPLGERLVIKSSLPLHQNSIITLLVPQSKHDSSPVHLNWRIFSNERLIVDIPDHILDLEELIWVFKIEAP